MRSWNRLMLFVLLLMVMGVPAALADQVYEYDAQIATAQFQMPNDVAAASAHVYVADTYNHRIQVFTPDGTLTNVWGTYGYADDQLYYPIGVAPYGGYLYVLSSRSRIQKFTTSGTFVLAWGEPGSAEEQVYQPQGITVDATGNVYIADTWNNRIQKFNATGGFIDTWGTSGTGDREFNLPSDLAIDSSGNIFVADTGNHRIQKLDPLGQFLDTWGSCGLLEEQFCYPHGVVVDASGHVYVEDYHNIHAFTTEGGFIDEWGSDGSGESQFSAPMGIGIDSTGALYVADTNNHRIQKFSSEGTFLTQWGSYGTGAGQSYRPAGVARDTAGNLFVADTGNNRIQKFNETGGFVKSWGSLGNVSSQFDNPQGIAVDTSGNVYVADTNNDRIQKFDTSGTFLTQWGTHGSGNTQFLFPIGVDTDAMGNVYVADEYNGRVQKYTASGTFLQQIGTPGSGQPCSTPGQLYGIHGVAVDHEGYIYTIDGNCARVQKFNPSGALVAYWIIRPWDMSPLGMMGLSGIAVDAGGNVHISDVAAPYIHKFNPWGGCITSWGNYGTGLGQFNGPHGLAIGPDEAVYVADTYNSRIQKFRLTISGDVTPPQGVTSLHNTTYHPTSITWVWTDPSDADFHHLIPRLNGMEGPEIDKGVQMLEVGYLSPDTLYTLSLKSVDADGNVNSTWVNNTARTAPSDDIPPAGVRNLHNTTFLPTSITWVWTDPTDLDLEYVCAALYSPSSGWLYLPCVKNGVQTITANGLTPNTQYTLRTNTRDTSGNLNSTSVNSTVFTSPPVNLVTECQQITFPGTYVLQNDILDSADPVCVDIRSSDVYFEGNGHTVDGIDTVGSRGIRVHSASEPLVRVRVANITVTNWDSGIMYFNAHEGWILNNTLMNNHYCGLDLTTSSHNILRGNQVKESINMGITLKSNSDHNQLSYNDIEDHTGGACVRLYLSSSNSFYRNLVSNCNSGIQISDGASFNYVYSNTVKQSSIGVWVINSSTNFFFDNIFNNSRNVDFLDSPDPNYWNISPLLQTNIEGGPYLGGNFWAQPDGKGFSQTPQTYRDTDYDGFINTPYVMDEYNRDNLPLRIFIKGDLNGDLKVDWGDVVLCAYMSWRLEDAAPLADFNGSGEVDWGDVVQLAYYYWGLIPEL